VKNGLAAKLGALLRRTGGGPMRGHNGNIGQCLDWWDMLLSDRKHTT
jgi:hypothetical protein